MNYLLTVFGKCENQDDFIKTISQDIITMCDSGNVKYYYGPESALITFRSSESLESMSEYLNSLYGDSDLVYILLPYETDKLSFKMDSEISKHLFNSKINNKKQSVDEEFDSLVQSLLGKEAPRNTTSKCKPEKELSLDEILDKINDKGISSLSKKELTLLNNYSNK